MRRALTDAIRLRRTGVTGSTSSIAAIRVHAGERTGVHVGLRDLRGDRRSDRDHVPRRRRGGSAEQRLQPAGRALRVRLELGGRGVDTEPGPRRDLPGELPGHAVAPDEYHGVDRCAQHQMPAAVEAFAVETTVETAPPSTIPDGTYTRVATRGGWRRLGLDPDFVDALARRRRRAPDRVRDRR